MGAPTSIPVRAALAAWLAVALGDPGALPAAQRLDPARVEEVKAAYIVNFVRYTEWPATRFAAPDSPYVVAVVGSEAVAAALEAVAERLDPIGGRRLSVVRRRLPVPESPRRARALAELAREAHLVYVGDELDGAVEELVEQLAGTDVLTVGELPGFAASGGMIGLRREGNRIVFDANPGAIRGSRVRVSARVLQLARIVGSGPFP